MSASAFHFVFPPLLASAIGGAIFVGLFLSLCLLFEAIILIAIIKVISVVWGFLAHLSQRKLIRRLKNGQCPDCGYDLRASPHRCPECGYERPYPLWPPSSSTHFTATTAAAPA